MSRARGSRQNACPSAAKRKIFILGDDVDLISVHPSSGSNAWHCQNSGGHNKVNATMTDTNNSDTKVECIDCNKKTQKDLPQEESTSSEGMPCASSYAAVTACMNKNNGQVAPCTKEWNEFKKCHEKNRHQ